MDGSLCQQLEMSETRIGLRNTATKMKKRHKRRTDDYHRAAPRKKRVAGAIVMDASVVGSSSLPRGSDVVALKSPDRSCDQSRAGLEPTSATGDCGLLGTRDTILIATHGSSSIIFLKHSHGPTTILDVVTLSSYPSKPKPMHNILQSTRKAVI